MSTDYPTDGHVCRFHAISSSKQTKVTCIIKSHFHVPAKENVIKNSNASRIKSKP
jgi:hypothetical protein